MLTAPGKPNGMCGSKAGSRAGTAELLTLAPSCQAEEDECVFMVSPPVVRFLAADNGASSGPRPVPRTWPCDSQPRLAHPAQQPATCPHPHPATPDTQAH